MPTKNIVPRANGEGSLGTSAKKWGAIYANEIVLANEQTLEAKLNAKDSEISSKFSEQDTTISTAIAAQDESINTRLSAQEGRLDSQDAKLTAQDAEVNSRLNAQDTLISEQLAQKADKSELDLKANQVDLEALANTSEIVASGSKYVRWANGVQICWDMVTAPSQSIAAGATYTINQPFPMAFNEKPTVVFQTFSNYFNPIFSVTNTSTTNLGGSVVNTSTTSRTAGSCCYIAVGHWK